MVQKRYFEDVQIGMVIPPLAKTVTLENLVRYCAALDYFHPIHYDESFARQAGFPGVLIHGLLKGGLMAQMLMDWAGPGAWITKLEVQYRRPDFPGCCLTCRGRVLNVYVQGGEGLVDLEIWVENEAGERTTPGSATVRLPRKEKELAR